MVKRIREGNGYLIDSRADWKQFVVNLRDSGKPTQDFKSPEHYPAIVFAEWQNTVGWELSEFIYKEDFDGEV